jgi:uncharacterized membrane protein
MSVAEKDFLTTVDGPIFTFHHGSRLRIDRRRTLSTSVMNAFPRHPPVDGTAALQSITSSIIKSGISLSASTA